jgi:RHS repeat-associated protein
MRALNYEMPSGRTDGPFGETLPGWSPLLAWDSDVVNYGYTGRQFDSESGLYYYRARMYNPATGRFSSTDPLGIGGGDYNPYRYAHNNPKVRKDPRGLSDYDPFDPFSGLPDTVVVEFQGSVEGSAAAAETVVVGVGVAGVEALLIEDALPGLLSYCASNEGTCQDFASGLFQGAVQSITGETTGPQTTISSNLGSALGDILAKPFESSCEK